MDEEINNLLKTTYKICLDEAVHLILAFLKEPKLKELALSEAIGGTVSRDAIKNEFGAIFNGSMGWYCRNQENNNYPKLFIAFEDGSYDVGKVPDFPTSETLLCPSSTFTYKGNDINEQAVLDMLLTDQIPLAGNIRIYKAEVMKFINQLPDESDGIPYNVFPCSFFENRGAVNRDIEEFLLHGSLVAVRYYFGYDTSYSHKKSNRIRVIFVGVDSNGKNIIETGPITTVTSRLVQNSWPPPPPPNSI